MADSTTKKNSPVVLYIGIFLTVISIIGIIFGYVNRADAEISSSDKLLIYSFITLATGLVVLGVGIAHKHTTQTLEKQKGSNVILLAQAALFAALAYIGFSYFRIDIPVGPGSSSFHLGNTFVVVAALLIGGPWGGLAGALGLSLADLTSGKYFTVAPQTFILKLFIGLITGLVAHKIFKINKQREPQKIFIASLVSSICGMVFNIIADPVVGFFYKRYVLGMQTQHAIDWTKLTAVTTSVNAIASVICAVILYNALRPALIRAHLYVNH